MLHCGEGVQATLDGTVVRLSHVHSAYTVNIELPTDLAELYFGRADHASIRGITGLGFMETAPIHTIECRVPYNRSIHWRIGASASGA